MNKTFGIVAAVTAISLIAGLVGWFWFGGTPTTARRPPCVDNLVKIDNCKDGWATDHRKGTNDIPSWDDLQPYFPTAWANALPKCPEGGTYTIGRVGDPPVCSIGGPKHSMP